MAGWLEGEGVEGSWQEVESQREQGRNKEVLSLAMKVTGHGARSVSTAPVPHAIDL